MHDPVASVVMDRNGGNKYTLVALDDSGAPIPSTKEVGSYAVVFNQGIELAREHDVLFIPEAQH